MKRLFWPILQQPALSHVTCFHATCEAEYRDIRRMGFKQPVAIIPNGIDEIPSGAIIKASAHTVLYLGRIHPEKGVETLLRAWRRVEQAHGDWRLQIVGPGKPEYVAKVGRLAKSLNLRRVEFTGGKYGAEKWEAYRGADLYVLPSPSENFAISVAEALMAGVPVISTKGTPWRGLEAERAGWWVDLGEEPLADAMDRAMRCSLSELNEMGQRGRAWMLRDFNWFRIGQAMSSFYRWLRFGGTPPSFVITD